MQKIIHQLCRKYSVLIMVLGLAYQPLLMAADSGGKLPIKVVVVSMFENGEATGDRPGELQLWVERSKLDIKMDFPLGEYDLYRNQQGVLAICVGGGIANATASIMALGLDSRFDLSKAYWLIAGISGGDPEDISLGSAAWVKHVVDGDLVYELDAREMPEHWPYGLIPLGAKEPADKPEDIYTGWTLNTISFDLNPQLAEWAYSISKDVELIDTPAIKAFRAQFKHYPNAQKPPFVTIGDTLSASTYWHGLHLNQWANDWLKLYGGSDANFMTSNMEDSGTLTALLRLARKGIVDKDRIMAVRTVSNYSMAPKDKPTSWSITADYPDDGFPALDTAYKVGDKVVQSLLNNWDDYKNKTPGS